MFHIPDNEAEGMLVNWNFFLFVFGFGIWLGLSQFQLHIARSIFFIFCETCFEFYIIVIKLTSSSRKNYMSIVFTSLSFSLAKLKTFYDYENLIWLDYENLPRTLISWSIMVHKKQLYGKAKQ